MHSLQKISSCRRASQPDRIRIEGRGELEPIADNDTEAGRRENRRVEVAIFASEEYIERAKAEAR
jgi:flagellar motor protein MotB